MSSISVARHSRAQLPPPLLVTCLTDGRALVPTTSQSYPESSPYPVSNESQAFLFSLNYQDIWLQTFQVQDTDLVPVMLDHNNILQEFPPYTVSNESQASLVALNHQDSWLQTFQVQDTDLVPFMLDHNNLFPAYTVSNESQGSLVNLDHYDSWLQTLQVQDTNLVHVPAQSPVAQAAPAPTQFFCVPSMRERVRALARQGPSRPYPSPIHLLLPISTLSVEG